MKIVKHGCGAWVWRMGVKHAACHMHVMILNQVGGSVQNRTSDFRWAHPRGYGGLSEICGMACFWLLVDGRFGITLGLNISLA